MIKPSVSMRLKEKRGELAAFLEAKVKEYNQPSFIPQDPISIPHRFSQKADIEIAAFFAAIFAWGNRTTIIGKAGELMRRMDNAPYQFIQQHGPKELENLLDFKHRTFNPTDLLYFIEFLRQHYQRYPSLETAFTLQGETMESMLNGFHQYFFSLETVPQRTRKHIACPERKSTCKRINMFLRWMVRRDTSGVDFGIWENISPAQLICPIDLHVARVARRFNLIHRKQTDWQTAIELTEYLRTLDPHDPVKYDFALFGMGVMEKY